MSSLIVVNGGTASEGRAQTGLAAMVLSISGAAGSARSWRLMQKPMGPEVDCISALSLGQIGTGMTQSLAVDAIGPYVVELWVDVGAGLVFADVVTVWVKDENGVARLPDKASRLSAAGLARCNLPGSNGFGYVDIDHRNDAAVRAKLAAVGSSTLDIDLRKVAGYSTADIGPALQTALQAAADAGANGADIWIPPVDHTLVTPVSVTVNDGNQIRLRGAGPKSVIIPNCGDTNNAITIGHASSAGNGARITFCDFLILAPADETFSCARFLRYDQSGNGVTELRDITVVGLYTKHEIFYIEDGGAVIARIQLQGVCNFSPNSKGLIQLYQVYRPSVRDITHYRSVYYRGTHFIGAQTYALIQWQAPQVNFGPEIPVGDISIDGVWCESTFQYPIILNDTATNRGNRAEVRNCKLTRAAGALACIFGNNIDRVNVENCYFTTGAVSVVDAVEFYNCGKVEMARCWSSLASDPVTSPNSAFAETASIYFFDSSCGDVFLQDCRRGSNSTHPAGVNSAAASTRGEDKGIKWILLAAAAAQAANSLVKFSTTTGRVALVGITDPADLLTGVQLDASAAAGDLVRVAMPGQLLTLVSDGAVAFNPGDEVVPSAVTAGRCAASTGYPSTRIGVCAGPAVAATPGLAVQVMLMGAFQGGLFRGDVRIGIPPTGIGGDVNSPVLRLIGAIHDSDHAGQNFEVDADLQLRIVGISGTPDVRLSRDFTLGGTLGNSVSGNETTTASDTGGGPTLPAHPKKYLTIVLSDGSLGRIPVYAP